MLPLANKVFSTDGVHTIELTVTKVNGNQNIAEDNTASNSIIALEKGAERTSVVEELTGTWCGWCPRGHVGLENLKKTFGDKVITLAGHYTFGENAVDPMNCYEYNQNDVFGNYGVVANQLSSYLGGSGLEMTYLALLEQKFAVTLSLVIGKRAIEIRADVHTLDPYFPTVYHTVAIDKRSLAGTYRLYLRTGEYHACRIYVISSLPA